MILNKYLLKIYFKHQLHCLLFHLILSYYIASYLYIFLNNKHVSLTTSPLKIGNIYRDLT